MGVRRAAAFVAAAMSSMVLTPVPSLAVTTPAPDPQGVVVTVPLLPYAPRSDMFRVGPYTSRLDVLHNDSGNPDPRRLELLDRNRNPVVFLLLRGVGRLHVEDGYVVLERFEESSGRGSFSYRAGSGNGDLQVTQVVVQVVGEVVRVARDSARTRRNVPVVLDVAVNDRVIVPGAVRVCGPQLFARRPRPIDPRPVVWPDPEQLPFPCESLGDPSTVLVTPAGRFEVDANGRVIFTPAPDFAGVATAYYRQATDNLFDLGVARLTVRVRAPRGTAVLGEKNGKPGTPATPGDPSSGDGGGLLPHTGAELASAGFLGAGLLLVGSAMVRAGRRRRQVRALDA